MLYIVPGVESQRTSPFIEVDGREQSELILWPVGCPADFFLSQNFWRLNSDALAPYSESLCKILASSDFYTPIFLPIKVLPRRTACTAGDQTTTLQITDITRPCPSPLRSLCQRYQEIRLREENSIQKVLPLLETQRASCRCKFTGITRSV